MNLKNNDLKIKKSGKARNVINEEYIQITQIYKDFSGKSTARNELRLM